MKATIHPDSSDVEPNLGTNQPPADSIPRLLPHHLEHLRASGLSDDTIRSAEIYSEANPQFLAAMLGWAKVTNKLAPALVFPFRGADGSNGYARVKPDRLIIFGRKPAKYLSPKGQPNQIYLPPGVADVLQRPDVELLITEGEKKSLKATQEGFACLGLVGVYGWKARKSEQLLPALECIAWKGRHVFIVFDSDLARNEQVQDAESRLAKHLNDRGAVVRVVRLPDGPDDDGKPIKMGLDDFLVAHGPGALRTLLGTAQEPEQLSAVELKAHAKAIDPCGEIAAYLKHQETDGVPRLRFWNDEWLLWRGGCYQKALPSEIRADVVRRINQTHYALTTSITNNCLEQLRAQAILPGMIEMPAWIGQPPNAWPADELLATRNQLVHLPSLAAGQADYCAPATPRFFTTAALDYDFDLQAPRPAAWLVFLTQLWPHDPQSIAALQEFFGYVLTADTRQQKILMLIGPPRSGKGTIARVLTAMIGKHNVAGPTLASFGTNFGLSSLLGKSLAIVSDARLSGRTDSAVVIERLLSISGEDSLTIDRKFLTPVTCKLPTRLMVLTNELPRLADASGALASRFVLLRLTASFLGRENRMLTEQLLRERAGILLWAIEGWRRLSERGYFVQPDGGEELLCELQDLNSPVGMFVRECCVIGPHYQVRVDAIFAEWRGWCVTVGRREPGTSQTFGRDLRAAVPGLTVCRLAENGVRTRTYDGIGLRPHP